MCSDCYIKNTDLDDIRRCLKFQPCPHCGISGMLILHGYIYGYNEYRSRRVIKGRRIFCSNRNRRKGCGRTVSYRFTEFIRRTIASSATAWNFFSSILHGSSIEKAYNSIDAEYAISLSVFLRLWKRFKLKTPDIRTILADNYTIHKTSVTCPYRETIHHLSLLTSDANENPIEIFQEKFQISFI